MTTNKNIEIAQTILNQLGGRRFVAMTGAKNFVADSENAKLSFKLPARFAKNGINHVSIRLTPMDVYTVKFSKIWASKVTEISNHNDIYCDMLVELFESETGLYTHL